MSPRKAMIAGWIIATFLFEMHYFYPSHEEPTPTLHDIQQQQLNYRIERYHRLPQTFIA